MSRNMGRNTTSPEQDFSEWNIDILERYKISLETSNDGRDRRIKRKVNSILEMRGGEKDLLLSGIQKKEILLGEYSQIFDATVEILGLIYDHQILDTEQIKVILWDLNQAENAYEVLKIQNVLLELLMREAIDYSDILYKHENIDRSNYLELKRILSQGKEYTLRYLELSDEVNSNSYNPNGHKAAFKKMIDEGFVNL